MKPFVLFMLALCMVLLQAGCRPARKPPTKEEVVGLYAARHATGEVETLELRKDGSSEQALFPNQTEYAKNGRALHRFPTKWGIGKRGFINLTPQMELYELGRKPKELTPIATPLKIDHGLGEWIAEGEYERQGSMISFNFDCGVILEKVIRRTDDIRPYGSAVGEWINPALSP